MNDRIKLAKAMGWKFERRDADEPVGMTPYITKWVNPAGQDDGWTPRDAELMFDPFTDANDDYAVLEWYREKYQDRLMQDVFSEELLYSEWGMPAYKIGDYARAALKVIDEN